MTSRERIKATLNHKEPDKIPIDCGAMHSSGISAITYNLFRDWLKNWDNMELLLDYQETKVVLHNGG